MIVRCPKCEFSRTISEHKIPPTAEVATCPKCKYRFRFRTIDPTERLEAEEARAVSLPPAPDVKPKYSEESKPAVDIWDAMDALHQRWEAQLDKPLPSVDSPKNSPADLPVDAPENTDTPADSATPREDTIQTPEGALNTAPQAAPAQAEPGQAENTAPLHSGLSLQPEQIEEIKTTPSPVTARNTTGQGLLLSPDPAPANENSTYLSLEERSLRAPEQNAPERPAFPAGQSDEAHPGQEDAPQPLETQPLVFPYNEDTEVAPEERVERDLLMLKENAQRPSRDLGRIDDSPSPELGDLFKSEEARQDIEVPWENPSKNGWVRGFFKTVNFVLFGTPNFFRGLGFAGALTPAYLFFLLLGYTAIICFIAWEHAARAFMGQPAFVASSPYTLPLLLLLAPFALGLIQIFLVGSLRLVAQLAAPENAHFSQIFRLVGYAAAPLIVSIIPFIGPVFGIAWFMISLMLGCRHALRFPWTAAILAPIPPVLLMAGVAFLYFH